jgi:uncharacterized protein (TIGR02646 family)
MLKYLYPDLLPNSTKYLDKLQKKVDSEIGREAQYALANKLFSSKTAKAWADVRAKLGAVAPGGDSCFYCERDRYRDIEHIFPKRHYPERSFDWQNYIYACTICNQDKKGDKFGSLAGDVLTRFDRSWPYTCPLPPGVPALINIRIENPLDFLKLDLDTGIFVEVGDKQMQLRANFTIELFGLNSNELPRHRVLALGTYLDYLGRWLKAYDAGDAKKMGFLESELVTLPHPTVLAEMRRQVDDYPEFSRLFEFLPPNIGAL